jgi:plastocyanin
MRTRLLWQTALGAAMVTILQACGGGGGGGSTPTQPSGGGGGGGGGGGTGSSSATITITASGVSPGTVTISAGGRVTFVNNDSRAHDMASDPHPEHTACPALNDVGFLSPGQSRTSGNLNTVRTCGFHDHNQPDVRNLQGTVVIQ